MCIQYAGILVYVYWVPVLVLVYQYILLILVPQYSSTSAHISTHVFDYNSTYIVLLLITVLYPRTHVYIFTDAFHTCTLVSTQYKKNITVACNCTLVFIYCSNYWIPKNYILVITKCIHKSCIPISLIHHYYIHNNKCIG